LNSTDPDDRDTAFEILAEIDSEESNKLLLGLIDDEFEYIQLQALGHLKSHYPAEVKAQSLALQRSANDNVRLQAGEIYRFTETQVKYSIS